MRAGRVGAAVACVLAIGIPAAACSSSEPDGSGTESGGATPSGGWSFEDDRGVTHTLPEVPDAIAAHSVAAGGLWEYGIEIDGVFGPLRRADGSPDPSIGLADPDDFTSLGEVDSEINIEALAALRPDIIVTSMWDDGVYWGISDEELDELERIAPIVGIRVDDRPVTEPLGRFAELAESLGGDPGRIDDARARFEAASAGLSDALAAKPDLAVVAASGSPSEMYVAYPGGFSDLRYFQSLGMQLATPESHPTSDGFWETLSWEEAGTYPADLILADGRIGTVEEITDLLPPTAAALPAVQADQLIEWPASHAFGYGNLGAIMEVLAAEVDRASPDVVD